MIKQLSKIGLWVVFLSLMAGCSSGEDGGSPSDATGQAGSMARFSIVDDYLYTISGTRLQLFNISEPANPTPYANVNVDWGIETIFSYQGALFVGTQQGVFIFDNVDPSNPQLSSEFTHATSCDPVVASSGYAYITLRDGNSCLQGLNQMDVLDVSDIYNPVHLKTVAMQNPKGLGVDQNRLFVCDGIAGLKVFDLSDPVSPSLIDTDFSLDCFDVIAKNGLLVVSDATGIIQYNYNFVDPDISLLSSILISNE